MDTTELQSWGHGLTVTLTCSVNRLGVNNHVLVYGFIMFTAMKSVTKFFIYKLVYSGKIIG
jgi:hypothetical protein